MKATTASRRALRWTALALILALLPQGLLMPFADGERRSGGAVFAHERDDVSWTRLTFKASKFLLKATTEVRLETVAPQTLQRELIDQAAATELGDSPQARRITIDSSFAGRRSQSQVLFDPVHGSALQRFKQRFGGKPYQKTQRYLRNGVFSLRRAPANADQGKTEPSSWTKIEESRYEHPAGLGDCRVVTDPAVLLYWLSTLVLEEGRKTHLCAFSQKSFVKVEIEVQGRTRIGAEYTVRNGEGEVSHQGEVDVHRVLLRPLENPQAGDEDAFEFLGLEGDVVLFVEGESRLPLQISGRVPGMGGIDIELREVLSR